MKKLITYLKALWRRGLDSQRKEVGVISGEATIEHPFSTYSAPFGTCWQPSGKLHSVVRYAAMLVMLFTIGSGNVWADYTIVFKDGSGTSPIDASTLSNFINSGASYVTSASSSYMYPSATTGYGIRLASGSYAGNLTLNLSATGQIKASKITFNAAYYGTDASTMPYTITYTDNTTTAGTISTLSTSLADKEVSLTSTKTIKTIYIGTTAKKKRVYVHSIAVTAAAAATPTVTPDPTSLSWGTVLQGSSQSTKTISITGANLTAGTLTISATGGYSVTPTSKSVSGTLSATTLTVTPPSTSTTGAKNGKVTINGGGLASAVEVNLSMTVNAASTVTWMNNGSEYTTTLVANGSKPEFPSNPSSCDGTSTTFVGWTPTPWSGKLDDVSAKTIYTSGSAMPNVSGPVTYHAVFAKASSGGVGTPTEKFSVDVQVANGNLAAPTGYTLSHATEWKNSTHRQDGSNDPAYIKIYHTSTKLFSSLPAAITIKAELYGGTARDMTSDGSSYYPYVFFTDNAGNEIAGSAKAICTSVTTSAAEKSVSMTVSDATNAYGIGIRHAKISGFNLRYSSITLEYAEDATTYSKYLTTCCTDPGLAYGTASVTKTYGASAFTNPLTNSHSVGVTYDSSDKTVATVDSEGEVKILKAGTTTISASFAGNATYCADEASYTLMVNKADISPTLSYTPNSVTVGGNTSAPTVGGNPGSGGVTYAITSATPAGCATINTSTGVVTGVAVGSVTVTATVAATTNYNGGSATANVTITAASNFPNGRTIFIQAGKSGSAWSDNACVVAWFHSYGGSETAQPTYWLFDVTAEGDDKGKKLFAAVVPSSGDLPYLDINRYASDCTTPWNKNGGVSYSDASGSNTIRSEGSGNDQVYWNLSGVTMELHGDPSGDEWESSLADVTDQGSGIWSGTYENYAPANVAGTSQDFKIKTNYNGWIGNTGSNNNATLDGMKVGSTYNITATLNVTTHALTMSKTFVKGTVHFDLQGHGLAISDLTNVTAGSKISAPGTPSATGYDFGGWYKEPACTNAWNFGSDVVNETMTLYAKWTKQTYTITSTLNNCSSSPAIPSSYEYTGSAAGLSYTITPSSGYRLPTDISVTGTTYTWNSSTGALVLTGTITSNVTITISAVQTHTVDWYVGGSAPANKIGDDGQTTVVDHGGKISAFPATTPDGSACDKVFVGWTNTSSYVHGTSPLFNDVAGSPTINADASFYAVFATGGSTTVYLTESEISTSFVSGTTTSYGNYTITSASGTWGGKITINKVTISAADVYCVGIRKNADNNSLGSPTFSGNISNITVTGRHNAGSARDIYICSSNATAQPTSGDIGSGSIPAGPGNNVYTDWTDVSITPTGDHTSFYIYANGGLQIKTVAVTYGGYSGYTINCASCGTSVTVSYSAPGSGNTMSVTKSATPVASGTSVKTCLAQELSVTLTPTTHYDITGFTATGLTTGTASISPTVAETLPKSTAQTFTVTISAGATGTLTLTPTFTAQTPLTITLSTKSMGTFTDPTEFPIYAGETFTFPDVTPNDPSCATFVGWIAGTTFVGDGTTHDAPVVITAGTVSAAQNANATYTAVFYETETTETDAYVKVTETPASWANDHYLIVDEVAGVAFDGSRTDGDGDKIDAASNTVAVSITSSAIAATNALAASEWKIALISGSNYSIQSASGKYIGQGSDANGLTTSASALNNTLDISSGDFEVVSAGGAYLRYNATSGQERFRYYKSSSYSSQHAIQLYKLGTAVVETRTYTTTPSCTPKYRVTVASVTGGSPSATPKFNPEDTEVTLTANPAAGYSFTSWAMENSSTHADATSLLSSSTATTATFSMPAYDVTVTASYAKKMVTELKVMDDETVVANTTGPVSGTLNVSTGANKTLDVVITPSDAFDHSWTATVSAGSTYASITNVTAEGFRVNGLAQGDATVTVTAPNDGSAKSVTLTVHVTDIMPEEIILKREGSNVEISELTMYYDTENSRGQYAKINVSYTPTPTNKRFSTTNNMPTKTATIDAPVAGYTTIHANGLTGETPATITFTSEANGSVTKVLTVTILPLLADQFVDYIHGNATQTVSARLSADRYSMITDINTPPLTDASDAYPTSEDCETAHYHLIGWLPQATAEALWEAGTPITAATEGLVRAGVTVEATGQTWYAIWAKEE